MCIQQGASPISAHECSCHAHAAPGCEQAKCDAQRHIYSSASHLPAEHEANCFGAERRECCESATETDHQERPCDRMSLLVEEPLQQDSNEQTADDVYGERADRKPLRGKALNGSAEHITQNASNCSTEGNPDKGHAGI